MAPRFLVYKWTGQSIRDMLQYTGWTVQELRQRLAIRRANTVHEWFTKDIAPSFEYRTRLTVLAKEVAYPYLERFHPYTGKALHTETDPS